MAYGTRTTINRRIAIARAHKIPAGTTDLRAAIKREIWSRGFTLNDVAAGVKVTAPALRVRLGAGWRSKRGLSPRLVDKIAAVIGVREPLLSRWHAMGAALHGWRIDVPGDEPTRRARG